MKITKLVLQGYKRFDLLNIQGLTYTPESPYQLILGVSGMGKSSLLYELSPLPCDSDDLKEGGYKQIWITNRNNQYELTYSKTNKIHCSFKMNEEELNDGGTIKVQKQLILDKFGYDEELHDLLIGHTKLTTLGPQQRREWFVRMSKADMTYALQIFNKIKSTERDIKGALKLNHQRLVSEQAKLPKEEDLIYFKQQNENLKQELNHLLPFLDKQLMDVTGELNNALEILEKLSNDFLNAKFVLKAEGKSGINVLTKYLEELTQEREKLHYQFNKSKEELLELTDIYNKHKLLEGKSLDELLQELQQKNQQYQYQAEQLQASGIKLNPDPKYQHDDFETCYDRLLQWCLNGIEKEDFYNKEHYQAQLKQRDELKEKLLGVTNKLNRFEDQLQGLKSIHDVDCPQCHHRFKPGVDQCKVTQLEEAIQKGRQLLQEAEKDYKTVVNQIEEIETFFRYHRQLNEMVQEYNGLFSLIEYFKQQPEFYHYPQGLIPKLDHYRNTMQLALRQYYLSETLQQLTFEVEKKKAAEGTDVNYIINRIQKLEETLTLLKQQGQRLAKRMEEYNRAIVDTDLAMQLTRKIQAHRSQVEQLTLQQVRWENNQKVEQLIAERQTALALNENTLREYTQAETIVKQLEETNLQLSEDQKALKVLATLLSPTDGLIAESLLGFIHQFLAEMQNSLDQIWVYSMRPHLAMSEEGVELDYKFRVDIKEGSSLVKDVSRLSTGQKEVMDFVFKLLVMQHLGLQDYPLYMDEVGGNFDTHHRDRLYSYVKKLVESNQVQQVFIISHISTSHDAMSTADRNVLETDGIMMDNQVNRYLTFH